MTSVPGDGAGVYRREGGERVSPHMESGFYDVEAFKAGHPVIQAFEIEEMGPLGDARLAHLQCRSGIDTLDLVRMHPTLHATGLDPSAPAVDAASSLAAELGLAGRASFVQGDVMQAASILGRQAFDVVYTGKGSIGCLPDLERWADQCLALLRPGAYLYLVEFHPAADALDDDSPTVGSDYFERGPRQVEATGAPTDHVARPVDRPLYEWNHTVSEVLDSVISAGFRLLFFREWDYTLFQQHSWLVQGDGRRWHWPSLQRRLPLMYSLKAQKEHR